MAAAGAFLARFSLQMACQSRWRQRTNSPTDWFCFTLAATSGKALISVSDKADLAMLGKGLADLGYQLVSTGGSAAALAASGLPVRKVEDLTGFPELLDGEQQRAPSRAP